MWGTWASETEGKTQAGLIGFWTTSDQFSNGELGHGEELGWSILARGEKQVRLKR
jgi:hypothetical protein